MKRWIDSGRLRACIRSSISFRVSSLCRIWSPRQSEVTCSRFLGSFIFCSGFCIYGKIRLFWSLVWYFERIIVLRMVNKIMIITVVFLGQVSTRREPVHNLAFLPACWCVANRWGAKKDEFVARDTVYIVFVWSAGRFRVLDC